MSTAILVAAGLIAFVGVAHSYLGERYILRRLFRRQDLPHLFGSDWFTKRTIRFAWHLTTVAWFGLAAVLLVLADRPNLPSVAPLSTDPAAGVNVAHVISATFGISAVVTAAASRGRHLAWILFAGIAVLTWVGA